MNNFKAGHEPGEFIGGTEVEPELVTAESERIQIKLESTESLVQSFDLFREHFNPKAGLIYYPCSGPDISITKSFPESKIVFLDQMEESIAALRQTGFEAVRESAQNFKLETKADILLLYNPQIEPSEVMLGNLNEKGYLLCNNYHETASLIKERKDFELKGIIRQENGSFIIDTQNLEQYSQDIDTDEELKNAPHGWGSVDYEYARRIVEKMTGKTENILSEYKKIIEAIKEIVRKQSEEFFAQNPDFPKEMYLDENFNPLTWIDEKGEQQSIMTGLPKKKGTVDDTFVFLKTT